PLLRTATGASPLSQRRPPLARRTPMKLKKHSHCSYCGAAYPADAPFPRTCSPCGNTTWVNPIPVAVCLLPVDGGLLVIRRAIPPKVGELALPGGYVDLSETWQQAAARELEEETG